MAQQITVKGRDTAKRWEDYEIVDLFQRHQKTPPTFVSALHFDALVAHYDDLRARVQKVLEQLRHRTTREFCAEASMRSTCRASQAYEASAALLQQALDEID